MTGNIAIGTRLWGFNEDRRVYPPMDDMGRRLSSGPIYAEHFVAVIIDGETPGCWLVGNRTINKRTLKTAIKSGFSGTQFYTDTDKDDNIWRKDHLYKIERSLTGCSTDQLRQIAKIIGYSTLPEGKLNG